MDVEVYPYLSGISWMASLLCADSYLLTAGLPSCLILFLLLLLLINEKIPIVQNIKGLSAFFAWLGIGCSAPGVVEVGGTR